jgi:hypothetical protein
MQRLRRDLVDEVNRLKGHVSDQEYAEAIGSLKALGGQVGAFAAMHAALVAGALGGLVGVSFVVASTGPVGGAAVAAVGGPAVVVGYLVAVDKLNSWYDELDPANRAALTKVLAKGITTVRVLRTAWKWMPRAA